MGQGLLVRRGGGGASANLQSINILSNGRYQASDYNVDGWKEIEVSVPMSFTSIDLSISQNGSYAPSDYSVDAFGNVTVDVQYATSALNVIDNGVYNPSDYGVQAFSEVTVNISVDQQERPFNLLSYMNGDLEYIDDVYGDVEYVGYSSNLRCFSFINLSLQSFLSYIVLPNCKAVGYGAFVSCTSLVSVDMPECSSMTGYGFSACINLQEINVPKLTIFSAYLFNRCSKLSFFDFRDIVTDIGSSAFGSCSSLSSIIGLGAIINIGAYAFFSCSLLTSHLSFPKCEYVGAYAFSGTRITSIDLPECSIIYSMAFPTNQDVHVNIPEYCQLYSSTGVSITQDVEYINNISQQTVYYASYNGNPYFAATSFFTRLSSKTIYLHSSCVTICSNVRIGSNSIYSLNLSNVKYICSSAFVSTYYSSCRYVYGPEVISIGSYAFSKSGTNFAAYEFNFPKLSILEDYCFHSQQYMNSLVTSYLVSVGERALAYCYSLSQISLSNIMVSIGSWAFIFCRLLSEISIASLNYMGQSAFNGCSILSYISIGGLYSIGSSAFTACYSLEYLNFPDTIIIGNSAFMAVPNGGTSYSKISRVYFPKCEQINAHGFYYMGSTLSKVRFPNLKSLGIYAMYRICVEKLEILASSVPYMADYLCIADGTFSSSAIIGKYASLYVPASMVSLYSVATNWVRYSSRLASLYSFTVSNSLYWFEAGTDMTSWCSDWVDNEDSFYISGTSIFTSDGSYYMDGITPDMLINDGQVINLVAVS